MLICLNYLGKNDVVKRKIGQYIVALMKNVPY